jgi:hypothetical protein
MIPILSLKMMEYNLLEWGLPKEPICGICNKSSLHQKTNLDGVILVFESNHFSWPDKPWMYTRHFPWK